MTVWVMVGDVQASITDGVWESEDSGTAAALRLLSEFAFRPGPEEPDVDYWIATLAVRPLGGEVTAYEPPEDDDPDPGRVY